jgi:hypothetical protein
VYAALPDSGGATTASLSFTESSVNMMVLPNIKSINFDQLQKDLCSDLLNQIGLSLFDLYPEEMEMVMGGIAAGIDDNFFFGFFQWLDIMNTHYDDALFIRGKMIIDATAIIFYGEVAVGANNSRYGICQCCGNSSSGWFNRIDWRRCTGCSC